MYAYTLIPCVHVHIECAFVYVYFRGVQMRGDVTWLTLGEAAVCDAYIHTLIADVYVSIPYTCVIIHVYVRIDTYM